MGQSSPYLHHLLLGRLLVLFACLPGENVPETEGLVARPCHYCAAVGAHGQEEHPVRVAHQSGHSFELRVAPDVDLVLRVAVGAHQLVDALAEGQVAYLRARVLLTQNVAGEDVSESEGAVGSASPRGQQPMLLGRPGQGFDCCVVVAEAVDGLPAHRPNAYLVVVAPRGQVLVVVGPLQSTDLLGVFQHLGGEVPTVADVPEVDRLVSRASSQHVCVPGHGPDSGLVPAQSPHLHSLLHVPQLHLAAVAAHCQVLAVAGPAHRGHHFAVQLAELGDLAGLGVPEVDAVAEPHCQLVVAAPVDQVQVEVVLEGGGVEHLAGHLADLPHLVDVPPVQLTETQPQLAPLLVGLLVVAQDVAVAEGPQVLLRPLRLRPQDGRVVNLSDRYVLGVVFFTVLVEGAPLFLLVVVVGEQFPVGDEAVLEFGGSGCRSADGGELFHRGKQSVVAWMGRSLPMRSMILWAGGPH